MLKQKEKNKKCPWREQNYKTIVIGLGINLTGKYNCPQVVDLWRCTELHFVQTGSMMRYGT